MMPICILDEAAIHTRLRRMAYEIYERNFVETELVIIGIDARGGYLAREIVDHLTEISPFDIHYIEAHLDRSTPAIGIDLNIDSAEELGGKSLVVIDDVLYTGSTLLHVVSILLHAEPKSIQTGVLIDRGHRTFPVSADMTGLQLSTTVHQHVSVEIDEESNKLSAYLL